MIANDHIHILYSTTLVSTNGSTTGTGVSAVIMVTTTSCVAGVRSTGCSHVWMFGAVGPIAPLGPAKFPPPPE